jgi:hypothetical protein
MSRPVTEADAVRRENRYLRHQLQALPKEEGERLSRQVPRLRYVAVALALLAAVLVVRLGSPEAIVGLVHLLITESGFKG